MFIPTSGNFEKMLQDPKSFYEKNRKMGHDLNTYAAIAYVVFSVVLMVGFVFNVYEYSKTLRVQWQIEEQMQQLG